MTDPYDPTDEFGEGQASLSDFEASGAGRGREVVSKRQALRNLSKAQVTAARKANDAADGSDKQADLRGRADQYDYYISEIEGYTNNVEDVLGKAVSHSNRDGTPSHVDPAKERGRQKAATRTVSLLEV